MGRVLQPAGGQWAAVSAEGATSARMQQLIPAAEGGAVGLSLTRLQAGGSLSTHAHAHAHVWCVQEGRGEVTVGQDRSAVEPGSVIMVDANEPHGVRAGPDESLTMVVADTHPYVKQIVTAPDLEDMGDYGYSQCVRVGPFVYVSGQEGIGTDHEIVSTEFEAQARAALQRVRLAVEAAGGTLADVVSMNVFVKDIRMGRAFTVIRRAMFGSDFPTSTLVGVTNLMVNGAMIEVQVTAVVGSGRSPVP